MKRILLLSALVLFCAGLTCFAQSLRTVEGRVVNEKGTPICGAVITVGGFSETVKSDSQGNFSIKVPYGRNYISADYPDHIPAAAEIDGSFILFKLKYDEDIVERREDARLKAYQDSLKAVATASAAAKKAQKKSEVTAKNDAYNEKFKNKGISHSIDFSYAYEMSQNNNLLYVYSGYRSYGNLHPMLLTYTLSYKFNRVVSLGVGAGVLYNAKSITIVNDNFASPNLNFNNFKEQRLDVPLFLNLKFSFCRTKVRPFMSFAGGYYFLSRVGMGECGAGCEFRFAKHCAFHIQVSAIAVPWPWFQEYGEAIYISTFNPGIKVGFDF